MGDVDRETLLQSKDFFFFLLSARYFFMHSAIFPASEYQLNDNPVDSWKGKYMKQLSVIVGLLSLSMSITAWAYEGKGRNPGDWKMMPASLESVQGQWHLRLRNLDLFQKYCTLRVTHKGDELIQDVSLLFKAD